MWGCRDSQSGGQHQMQGPPHGGTPVAVGKHKYHLELVRDAQAGRMQAYVLDAHFEKFIAVPETNFALLAKVGGRDERLDFSRMPATPPSADGSSYLFESRAEWIKNATNFHGLIPTITLKGRTYTNIAFPFPEGAAEPH